MIAGAIVTAVGGLATKLLGDSFAKKKSDELAQKAYAARAEQLNLINNSYQSMVDYVNDNSSDIETFKDYKSNLIKLLFPVGFAVLAMVLVDLGFSSNKSKK